MARKGIPAWLDEETARRLDALKVIPRESRRDVVLRLLDEHDARAPSSPSQSPEKQPFFRRVFGGDPRAETQRRETAASDETARAAALEGVPS